jgi:hypothetical protein
MYTPTGIDILAWLWLVAIFGIALSAILMITLGGLNAYIKARKREEKVTWRQALRLGLLELKTPIISALRVCPLFIVITPLPSFIAFLTEHSILLLIALALGIVHGTVQNPLLIATYYLISIAGLAVMHYFLSKYGSIYKLFVMAFVRRDFVKQLIKRHEYAYKSRGIILLTTFASFVGYVNAVLSQLVDVIDSPSVLVKISAGIVIALMLAYVIPNKKYDNAISLMEKICMKTKCEESQIDTR